MKDICRFILESPCRRRMAPVRASRAERKWAERLRLTYPEAWRDTDCFMYTEPFIWGMN